MEDFRLVELETDGAGLDGFHFIHQGHLFRQKDTYGETPQPCCAVGFLYQFGAWAGFVGIFFPAARKPSEAFLAPRSPDNVEAGN